MTRLSPMLEEARRDSRSGALAGPPGSTRLTGLLERSRAAERDPGRDFEDAFDLATDIGAPLGTVELFYPEIAADRDRMARARPADPLDIGPVEQTPDVRIGLAEQIRRMDEVDWLKRMPLSPAGAIEAAELAIAADRLRKGDYARIAEQEVWAATPRILAGPGKGQRAELPAQERARRLAETETFWRDRDVQKIEQYLLDRLEVASRGQTFAAKVFEGLSYLPAWMIEFSLTGGLNQLGSETAKGLAVRTLQGYAGTTGGRAVLKGAGWTGGAITRATLGMPHRVIEQILDRRISEIRLTDDPDNPVAIPVAPESWATSLAKGWGSVVIEVASEQAGEGLVGGAKWVGTKTIGRLPFGSRYYEAVRQAWLSLHPEKGAAAVFAERFFSKAGYHGILGELGEERLATVLHAVAGTQDFGLGPESSPLDRLVAGMKQDLQLKNLAVETTVLLAPAGARAGLAAGGRAYVRSQLVSAVAEKEAQTQGLQTEGPGASDAVRTAAEAASATKLRAPEGLVTDPRVRLSQQESTPAAEPASSETPGLPEATTPRFTGQEKKPPAGWHSPENALRWGRPPDDYHVELAPDAVIDASRRRTAPEGYVLAWSPHKAYDLLRNALADRLGPAGKSDRSEAVYFYTPNGRSIRLAMHDPAYLFADSGVAITVQTTAKATGDIVIPSRALLKINEIVDAAVVANERLRPLDMRWHDWQPVWAEETMWPWMEEREAFVTERQKRWSEKTYAALRAELKRRQIPVSSASRAKPDLARQLAYDDARRDWEPSHPRPKLEEYQPPANAVSDEKGVLRGRGERAEAGRPVQEPGGGGETAEAGGVLEEAQEVGPEGPSVWDEAIAGAEAEAAAQAAERYQGPSEFVYEDLLPALEDREMPELRRMGRATGVRISGASKDTYRKFIADAVFTLTKTEEQPPAMIEGEPHPGSVSFGKFMNRYGEVLSWPDRPGHAEWNARYGRMESEGMRGLHRRLQHEWHKINAWALFHELTGQTAPAPPIAAPAAAGATEGPSGEPVDPDWPRTQNEAADLETDLAAGETADAMNEYAGKAAPADLDETAVEPAVSDVGFVRRLLHNWGIRSADGYEPLGKKDFREFFKYLQMPGDIARTFRQFMGVYKVQMAREIAKQVLDRRFAETLTPYFDLSNAERRAVDELLIAAEQHPGDSAIAGPLLAKLSAEQHAGYKAVREALDEAAEMLIARMREAGVPEERLEDFAGRIGSYIPHKWYGAWAVVVREKMTPEQMKAEGRRPSTEYMSAVGRRQRFAERERLGKLFPNAEVEVLKRTNVPYEAFQDAPAWAVGRMVDLVIEQAEAKVPGRPDLSEDAKAQLREAFKDLYKAKGFGMHFIQRKETPGWTEDLRRPLAGYFAGFSGFLTKMEAAFAFAEAIQGIDPRRTPKLYQYASEYVRYVMGDQTEFGLFKQLLYRYYLYGNLKSAVTNLTGNLVLGWPVLSKQTNWPLAKLLVAMADTAVGRLSNAENTFLTQMEEAGYLDPKLSQEISARGGNAIYRQLKGPLGKTLSFFDFFRQMERFNRRSMAVALHRAGIVEPGQVNELVEEAHFHYAKGNRPTLARGMASPIMVFRSFTINQCTWIKNEIKAGRVSPLARHMLAWTLIGGLRAMPFAAPLVLLYARIFKRDPEGDARELLGGPVAETLFRGLPSQGGVSMTGSVGMLDVVPTIEPGQSWTAAFGEWVGGVGADIPGRLGRVSKDLASGQYLRALEDASPEALRNPLAAWRLYSQGARTRSGRPILDLESHSPMHLTEAEAALKAMGFSPDRVKQQYDLSQVLAAIAGERQMLKQHWADRFYLAAIQKDPEGMQEVLAERQEHEAAMRAKGRPDLVISTKELDGMVRSRLAPVNLPDKGMIETYARIWRQYYGESKNEK
ncbi:MAG TPA: PLxRFG domain-containing protein [Phycisphaerae bacterium]|nr:PLxRFG domain-containing protein [Phycisphaerae bacterium]